VPGEITPGVEAAVIAARLGRKGTVEMLQSNGIYSLRQLYRRAGEQAHQVVPLPAA